MGGGTTPGAERWLLTPGPLSTSTSVKRAMLRDLGSRDPAFAAVTREVRERVLGIAGGEGSHTCVPLQGSGTFAVEAMLGTLIPPDGRVLVLVNGAYGRRMVEICRRLGRQVAVEEVPEDHPLDPEMLRRRLARDAAIDPVAMVHCETTTGILNPLDEVAAVTAAGGRRLLVDAMSSLGALPVDLGRTPLAALAASGNKCLEGVPGVGLCVVEREALAAAAGRAPSLSLDLHQQWAFMEETGQWRFTPPTHAMLALHRALAELEAEGGVAGRRARYEDNRRTLVAGMRALGFETLLPDRLQAPIIVTFRSPADPRFDFEALYARVAKAGYLLYPGKVTRCPTFRVGCIGRIGAEQIRGAVAAIGEAVAEMGIAGLGGTPS